VVLDEGDQRRARGLHAGQARGGGRRGVEADRAAVGQLRGTGQRREVGAQVDDHHVEPFAHGLLGQRPQHHLATGALRRHDHDHAQLHRTTS